MRTTKVVIVNGKNPNAEAVKKALEANPEVSPVFIDMGKTAALKFVKSFGYTGDCISFRGVNKTTHEQRLNIVTSDKRVEVIGTVGSEKEAVKAEAVKKVAEKKEKIYETTEEAEKACAYFTDYVNANRKEICDDFGWGMFFNEVKAKKLAMKMGATSVRYFKRSNTSRVYFKSEAGRSYFVELS